jgi:peptidoglycan hydrolase-like protein with peptidoglycan-binding domain
MNNPFNFEPVPLKTVANCGCQSRELETDMREFESEEEARGGRRFSARGGGSSTRSFRAPLRTMKKAPRPPLGRPKQPWLRRPYRGRWLTGPVVEDHSHYREPSGGEPEPSTGTEHTRWVQDCLNQALGLQLPVTGVMGPETRSAVRSFQRQQGIRVSGIMGPDTEEALKVACGDQRAGLC